MSPRRPQYAYLKPAEVEQLDILLRRAARHLQPAERSLLLRLHEHRTRDGQQAHRTTGGLREEVRRLRRQATPEPATAEAEVRIALALAVLNGTPPDDPEHLAHEIREALTMPSPEAQR
jgi:hypothetical protein